MAICMKEGVEVSMPELDGDTKLAMERCADFIARMIRKYGKEVLAEIESAEKVKSFD